jgi:hypothetical protein
LVEDIECGTTGLGRVIRLGAGVVGTAQVRSIPGFLTARTSGNEVTAG